jgi:hypothetical protein
MGILTILMVYTFQIVWTLTTLLKLALAVMWSPRKIFYKKERNGKIERVKYYIRFDVAHLLCTSCIRLLRLLVIYEVQC